MIECLPGFLDELFCRYVGPSEEPIDFIGRHERLAVDLGRALTASGAAFDERALVSLDPVNTGDFSRLRAVYPLNLARALLETEGELLKRFYPDHGLPRYLSSPVAELAGVAVRC